MKLPIPSAPGKDEPITGGFSLEGHRWTTPEEEMPGISLLAQDDGRCGPWHLESRIGWKETNKRVPSGEAGTGLL